MPVVVDWKSTPILAFRGAFSSDIEERLVTLMTMGDDCAVRATYVAGERVYDRDAETQRFRYPGEGA